MVSKYVALLYLDEARTALIVKQLKSTQPPSETASKLAYYHCLSKCFDILQDVPSKVNTYGYDRCSLVAACKLVPNYRYFLPTVVC